MKLDIFWKNFVKIKLKPQKCTDMLISQFHENGKLSYEIKSSIHIGIESIKNRGKSYILCKKMKSKFGVIGPMRYKAS